MLGARSPATPTLNSASIHTCPTDSCLYYTPYSVLFPVILSHQSCHRGSPPDLLLPLCKFAHFTHPLLSIPPPHSLCLLPGLLPTVSTLSYAP